MDLYEALGVRPGATPAEIRRAWQRRARALHPALNPGDPATAERYRQAAFAFEVLSDERRRAAYDRGELQGTPAVPAPEGGFEGFDFSARVEVQTVGFREIFDATHRGSPDRREERGEDLEQATRVSFEESMRGTTRRIHLVRHEPCSACQGSGDTASKPMPCPRCQGKGQLRGSRGHMIFTHPCPDCGGTGSLTRRPCARCSGEGRELGSEWLEVAIPAGVGDASQVRLPGAGNAGRRGGASGDFVLTVYLDPSPVFRREGQDLHCVVTVGLVVAATGGHIEVPTPEGPMTIEIPAGTQSGQRFRLRKRGVPHPGEKGRGDLWVEARIVVPAVTDDRGRELLDELGRLLVSDEKEKARDAEARSG
jgi:molecular chaperone DnaJ